MPTRTPTRSFSKDFLRKLAEASVSAKIFSSAREIPAAVWNGLVPHTDGVVDNPFLDHAFFLALEQSGCASAETGWLPRHVLVENEGQPVGLMPLYLKSHSQGEYVFDWGWADAFERAGGRYYPKLQASVPFTPVPAPKLNAETPALKSALLGVAETLCTRIGASSVHATFVTETEESLAREAGWLIRHDTQYHWHNRDYPSFETFLDSLASRKRKAIRRERREALSEGLRIDWITGTDLTEAHWDAFYAFYRDTGDRKWGQPYLNRTFFSLLSTAMADRIVLIFAFDGQTPIAGALNLIGKDTLYGRNWGTLRDVPFLHFEVCYYQAIDFAICHGLKTVEAGAQGEHKLTRGYEPVITRSLHWIAHAGLRRAVSEYLEDERAAIDKSQDALNRYTPFRRGKRPDEND